MSEPVVAEPSYDDALPPAAPDPRFDNVAALTRRVLKVPNAQVTIVTADEQRIPGGAADNAPWEQTRSLPLSYSICQYVVADHAPLVLPDTHADPRLADNRSVLELDVAAYAGMPLTAIDGSTVGALCVTDDHPREWTPDELDLMNDLAALCSSELQLRQSAARAAVAADRDRIARDLHSQVFSQLSQLSLLLAGLQARSQGDAAEITLSALDVVDDVLKTIRRTIFARGTTP
ncbi:GAF domain-containing protein [Jatrophihabitans endophyticus]|uniref:GAF domain-containing protein n=1 Tax=Jatrophihabitans endophyticus TaxID=1206085 RepID=UPI0019F641D7|nr:GAF domain-containing protein [Jatrophihabitans endophyticus]MBE7187165.1 GAF domain-containing protein [Jatrophihabitans endophyticus]